MNDKIDRRDILVVPSNNIGEDYIVGDIHGYNEIIDLLITRLTNEPNSRLFICGDLIDRRKQGYEVCKAIADFNRENPHPSLGQRIYSVRGNHEDAFLRWYQLKYLEKKRDSNRYLKAKNLYFSESMGGRWVKKLSEEKLKFVYDFIKSLSYIISLPNFDIVHANMPFSKQHLKSKIGNNNFTLSEDEIEQATLDRDDGKKDINIRLDFEEFPKITFCGHTIFGGLRVFSNSVNLDVGAYCHHHILVVGFNTKVVFYLDVPSQEIKDDILNNEEFFESRQDYLDEVKLQLCITYIANIFYLNDKSAPLYETIVNALNKDLFESTEFEYYLNTFPLIFLQDQLPYLLRQDHFPLRELYVDFINAVSSAVSNDIKKSAFEIMKVMENTLYQAEFSNPLALCHFFLTPIIQGAAGFQGINIETIRSIILHVKMLYLKNIWNKLDKSLYNENALIKKLQGFLTQFFDEFDDCSPVFLISSMIEVLQSENILTYAKLLLTWHNKEVEYVQKINHLLIRAEFLKCVISADTLFNIKVNNIYQIISESEGDYNDKLSHLIRQEIVDEELLVALNTKKMNKPLFVTNGVLFDTKRKRHHEERDDFITPAFLLKTN